MADTNGSTDSANGRVAFTDQQVHHLERLVANISTMRSQLISAFFDSRRNIENDCGYPPLDQNIDAQTFRILYDRESIAARVVQLFPKECWQVTPYVYEDEKPDNITEFENAWDELGQAIRGEQCWYQDEEGSPVWDYLKRVDTLSGIGYFGVLLIGIDDGKNLDQPVDGVVSYELSNNQLYVKHLRRKRKFVRNREGYPLVVNQGTEKRFYPSDPKPNPSLKEEDRHEESKFISNARRDVQDQQKKKKPGAGTPPAWASAGMDMGGQYPDQDNKLPGGQQPIGSSLFGDTSKSDTSDQQVPPKKKPAKPLPEEAAGMDWGGQEEDSRFAQDATEVDSPANKNPSSWRGAEGTDKQYDRAWEDRGNTEPDAPDQDMGQGQQDTDGNFTPGLNDPGKEYTDPNRKGSTKQQGDRYSDQGDGDKSHDARDTFPLAGAQGTDAQYVGVELSPPEYPSQEVSKEKHKLLFLRPYDESIVQIVQYEADVRNPRFGQPVMYRITLNDPREQHSGVGLPLATVRVHWSRVIHVADNLGSSEIFGVPRMRPVINRIYDIKKIQGASGEGYWKSAFSQLSFETHPSLGGDVEVDQSSLRNIMENVDNGMQRWWALSGMEAKSIAPQVVDPTPHIACKVEEICIQMGCPIRVFKGSERGELASSQDDSAWNDRLRERQNNYLTPRVIVPFIDRLIAMGILPEPQGYSIEWPDLDSLGDKDKAGVAMTKTQAIAAYVSGQVESVMPPKAFFTTIMGMDEEEVDGFLQEAQGAQQQQQAMGQLDAQGQPIESTDNPQDASQQAADATQQAQDTETGQPSGEDTPPEQASQDAHDATAAATQGQDQSGADQEGGDQEGSSQLEQELDQSDPLLLPAAQAAIADVSSTPGKSGGSQPGDVAQESGGTLRSGPSTGETPPTGPKPKPKVGGPMTIPAAGELGHPSTPQPPPQPNIILGGTNQPFGGGTKFPPGQEGFQPGLSGSKGFNPTESPGSGALEQPGAVAKLNKKKFARNERVANAIKFEDLPREAQRAAFANMNDSPGSKEASEIKKEPTTPPPPGKAYKPKVEADSNKDHVTDTARVGVPAMHVPPPPPIGKLPNLTPQERAVEKSFTDAFEKDPKGLADKFHELVSKTTKPGQPKTFGTDDAKALTDAWSNPDLAERSKNRATLNTVLHQTANAIAKRAFVKELDTLKPGDELMVTVGGCGCHVIDTPIMTSNGGTKMVQDIKSGDRLMGPDSESRRVLRLIRGRGKLYKIVPIKGKSFVVNEDHVLSLHCKCTTGRRGEPVLVNMTVKDFLCENKSFQKDSYLYRVGVEFGYDPIPLDPYFLGIWLGNGTHSLPQVTTQDTEVAEYLEEFAGNFPETELVCFEKQSLDGVNPNKAKDYKIALIDKHQGKGSGNPVTNILKILGVFKNKHIPRQYMVNDRHTRLRLLAGLLDTDGTVDKCGFSFCTKDERMAYDVAYLSRSLGFAAYVKSKWVKSNLLNEPRMYWYVSIYGEVDEIPTIVARKQPRKRVINKDPLRVGFTVEEAGEGDFYGFTLEGDGLYLLDDFTVTHNSGKGYALKNVPTALAVKDKCKAVWDSAGDQNATENPWIQKEAEKRGLKVNYVYVHADAKTQWADPSRGVVKRAQDPNDGRMVDSKVFADSYVLGAKNHQAFYESNKDNPHASFTFLENGKTPKEIPGIPKEALEMNRKELAHFAESVVKRKGVPEHVRRGALLGTRIWGND